MKLYRMTFVQGTYALVFSAENKNEANLVAFIQAKKEGWTVKEVVRLGPQEHQEVLRGAEGISSEGEQLWMMEPLPVGS